MKGGTGSGQPGRPLTLGIAGGGRAAWAYGSSWKRAGWPVEGVWLRETSESALPELLGVRRCALEELRCDLLLVAVSDRAIGEVAARAAATGSVVFHASGATPSPPGGFSLHPLRALPPVGVPSDLRDALLVFEGEHRDLAAAAAAGLEARFAEIAAADKARYHAGAVFGANYVAALLEIAGRLIGLPDAREDIAALAGSAIENWRTHPGPGGFTGPAARGDTAVLRAHLDALSDFPEIAELYRLLAAEIQRDVLASPK